MPLVTTSRLMNARHELRTHVIRLLCSPVRRPSFRRMWSTASQPLLPPPTTTNFVAGVILSCGKPPGAITRISGGAFNNLGSFQGRALTVASTMPLATRSVGWPLPTTGLHETHAPKVEDILRAARCPSSSSTEGCFRTGPMTFW